MRRDGIAVEITPTAKLGFGLVADEFRLEPREECMDLFTVLYEPEPRLRTSFPPGIDETFARSWHTAMHDLLETAQYQGFHESTVLDHELSGVAVKPLLEEMKQLQRRYHDMLMARRERQLSDAELAARQEQLYGESLRHVIRGLGRAQNAVEMVQQLRLIGYGDGAGEFVALQIDRSHFDAMAELVRKVSQMYGRFREAFRTVSVNSTRRALLVKGVTSGKELRRAIPSQLSWLSDPDMEQLFLLKWLEGRLLVRELSTPPRQERGDVVVCVDESGSMAGEKVQIAKAYAFALRSHLQEQGRRCHILSFSHREEHIQEIPDDAPPQSVLEWLNSFIAGGTAFEPPLERAMQLCDDRSDILIITDGQAPLEASFQRRFLEWKQRTGARLFLLHLERQSALRDIADHVLQIDDVSSVLYSVS